MSTLAPTPTTRLAPVPSLRHEARLTPVAAVSRRPTVATAGLIPVPPHPACEWCVVIPARNEEAGVATTVNALADQRDGGIHGTPLARERYEIILLANNCSDHTAAVARRAAARHPGLRLHVVERTIPAPDAHVGTARRLLMDEAHRRLAGLLRRPNRVIATTDADSRVAPDWLTATAAAMAATGAGAVGGLIYPCREGRRTLPPGAQRLARQDRIFQVLADYLEHLLDPDPADPWPRHYHHFGGSLALTADAYARVGGLPPLPALEDLALVRALRRHDVPVRHCPAVRVWTSARCDGRTPHGLAATLRRWTETAGRDGDNGLDPLGVESPAALVARVTLRRTLRALWRTIRAGDDAAPCADRDQLRRAARALGLSPTAVRTTLAEPVPFGTAHERLLDAAGHPEFARWPLTNAAAAIPELRARVQVLTAAHPSAPSAREVENAAGEDADETASIAA